MFEKVRSNHSQTLCKIGALKNFAMFTGKHLCWCLLLMKLKSNFVKKKLQHRCFCVNIAKFLRACFFKKHLWWLLLEDLKYASVPVKTLVTVTW